ncbi:MAG: protein kinase [Vicinamibacterales bacterium]
MVGQTLGHYRILSPIGHGAMGQVFAAEDVRLGRRVAVKLLPPEACCDREAVERFQHEARIISSLNHPHICTLYDIGVHDGRQFMVMELLEGEPLDKVVARGPLPLTELLQIGADVAGALDAAHRQSVIHRDIKPANLFLTAASGVKVLDFGVAKLTDLAGANDTTRAGSDPQTALGTAVGTVAYMSPEQARGEPIDTRSDLFTLGVVLYEMATGRPPFRGATPAVVFEGILTKTPPPPSSLRVGLPPEFDRIVARALEKRPDDRYGSAADLRADLKRLEHDTEHEGAGTRVSLPIPAVPAGRGLRRWWWLGAPVATAAVVAGVVWWQAARTPALQSRDAVVLTALTNRTGDAMFDDTLREALAVQLGQSPYLALVPEQRVQATLRQMQRPADTVVDAAVGREVCQRVGAKAVLTSALASLGASYVITLRALDCVTGDPLAEQQAQAARKEDVLHQLGESTRMLRERLGESLASISRYDANVEEATTASLEALKAYSQGMIARRTEGDLAALPLFRRAVELDPDFALAHARLGTAYSNLGDADQTRAHTIRAFELRERVGQLERLYIEARYYDVVQHDEAKALEAYRVSIATYPSDHTSRVNAAAILMNRGEYEPATALLREATTLAPEEPLAGVNLGEVLLQTGRYDEARKELERVLQLRDDVLEHVVLMTAAIYSGDAELEARQRQWALAVDDHPQSASLLWQVALHRGRAADMERWLAGVERAFEGAGSSNVAGGARGRTAIALAAMGLGERARAALEPGPGHSEVPLGDRLGVAALLRDAEQARRLLPLALDEATRAGDDLAARSARALAEEAAGRSEAAATTLGPVARRMGHEGDVLLHGYLALQAGRLDDAAADFEWLRTGAGKTLTATHGLARYWRALALDRAGRTDEARQAYADFLEFWKTADAEAPIVVSAKTALARLGS